MRRQDKTLLARISGSSEGPHSENDDNHRAGLLHLLDALLRHEPLVSPAAACN